VSTVGWVLPFLGILEWEPSGRVVGPSDSRQDALLGAASEVGCGRSAVDSTGICAE
jgi:hypothetical protein